MSLFRSVNGRPAAPASSRDFADDPLEPARLKFRALIVDRIMAFEAFRTLALRGEELDWALTSISELAHKIAGVGATLGFDKVGELAFALERAIVDGPRVDGPRGSTQRFSAVIGPLLESLLVELEAQLDD